VVEEILVGNGRLLHGSKVSIKWGGCNGLLVMSTLIPVIQNERGVPFFFVALSLAFALFVLNGPLQIAAVVQNGWVSLFVPVSEVALVVVLLLLSRISRRRKRVASRILLYSAAVIHGTLMLFSGTEGFVRYFWGRPFSLVADTPMLQSVYYLIFGEIGELAARLVPLGIGIIIVLGILFSLALVTAIRATLSSVVAPQNIRFSMSTLVLVGLLASGVGNNVSPLVYAAFQGSEELELRLFEEIETSSDGTEDSGTVNYLSAPVAVESVSILDRDIHLFLIETYGYSVFSRNTLLTKVQEELRLLDQTLRDEGYFIASTAMDSTVYGGFSWLAETTLLTGQKISSQMQFTELVERSRDEPVPSIARTLHDRGFYTLAVKPGTIHGSWPEGWDVFRFEDSLVAHDGDFNYRGPWFSYVAIADQFAIWTAHQHMQQVRRPGGVAERRHAFIHYQLVSSHTPFNRIPWYLENWDELGDGTIYGEQADRIRRFNNNWGGGTEMDEGYAASIGYVLETIAGYVRKHLDNENNPVLIITGDHQAQRPIRENDAGPGVPLHIATRDEEIYEQFLEQGLNPGLFSVPEPPHVSLAELFPMLLRMMSEREQ
jgi:hypothetical protein